MIDDGTALAAASWLTICPGDQTGEPRRRSGPWRSTYRGRRPPVSLRRAAAIKDESRDINKPQDCQGISLQSLTLRIQYSCCAMLWRGGGGGACLI